MYIINQVRNSRNTCSYGREEKEEEKKAGQMSLYGESEI
jgi:hypothetical protein